MNEKRGRSGFSVIRIVSREDAQRAQYRRKFLKMPKPHLKRFKSCSFETAPPPRAKGVLPLKRNRQQLNVRGVQQLKRAYTMNGK